MKIRNNINPFTLASTNVMERIAIDTIGPIEEGQGKYKFVIVIIDAFTRYTKLYPAETTKAEHALPAMLDWISQFGCPSEIVSDNGTQFVNTKNPKHDDPYIIRSITIRNVIRRHGKP